MPMMIRMKLFSKISRSVADKKKRRHDDDDDGDHHDPTATVADEDSSANSSSNENNEEDETSYENNENDENDASFGYGNNNTENNDPSRDDESKVVDYGYGGYEEETKGEVDYGYGYEDASPTPRSNNTDVTSSEPPCHRSVMPRRSSLKNGRVPRRSSIRDRGEIEVTVPTGKQIKRRVSIGYSAQVEVREVAPLSELMMADDDDANKDGSGDSEKSRQEQLWFRDEDYRTFKAKNKKIVRLSLQDARCADLYCTRGLERLLHRKEYKQRRLSALYSVSAEQEMQRQNGTYNDEEISQALYAQQVSLQSQAQALQRAVADAVDVRGYTRDTRRMMRRMSM